MNSRVLIQIGSCKYDKESIKSKKNSHVSKTNNDK